MSDTTQKKPQPTSFYDGKKSNLPRINLQTLVPKSQNDAKLESEKTISKIKVMLSKDSIKDSIKDHNETVERMAKLDSSIAENERVLKKIRQEEIEKDKKKLLELEKNHKELEKRKMIENEKIIDEKIKDKEEQLRYEDEENKRELEIQKNAIHTQLLNNLTNINMENIEFEINNIEKRRKIFSLESQVKDNTNKSLSDIYKKKIEQLEIDRNNLKNKIIDQTKKISEISLDADFKDFKDFIIDIDQNENNEFYTNINTTCKNFEDNIKEVLTKLSEFQYLSGENNDTENDFMKFIEEFKILNIEIKNKSIIDAS
jgi:hypothetical protein